MRVSSESVVVKDRDHVRRVGCLWITVNRVDQIIRYSYTSAKGTNTAVLLLDPHKDRLSGALNEQLTGQLSDFGRWTVSWVEEININNCVYNNFNFRKIDKDYFDDGRIVFNLCGKFERRKHHAKVLSAWANKYGGDNRYVLQCALYNHFLSPEDNEKAFMMALGGKKYSNIHILSPMEKNAQYNDFLNSADIILGMSGGEGWGLPEFHSTALGKHSVILNAHGYKGWADEFNSCLVEPSGKTECYDGTFFLKGAEFNQGSIYDWEEDAFIDACEKAIERRKAGKVNEHGLSLQQDFTVQKTVDTLLKGLEDM